MEKLINLLNEYEKNRIEKINSEGKLMVKLSFKPYTEEALTNKAYRSCWLEICSKYYGFIKRLVDNDKIIFDENEYKKSIEKLNGECRPFEEYELLLMILSIEDDPIDFLIGVLR